jgi:hypothetical protein
LKCCGIAKVASTAESTALAERNETVRRTSSNFCAAWITFLDQSWRLASNSWGTAPWKL